MSGASDRFAPRSEAQVIRLIEENPLAWVISHGEDTFEATPLPLRAVVNAQGHIERLVGHFARSNRQVAALRHDPRAIVLFLGPNRYISPSWMHDRTWGPTWNYASAQFVVDIEFWTDPAKLDWQLQDLIGAMEKEGAWRSAEMGPRYAQLTQYIVGFDAHIRARRAKFKLGQDERDAIFADIVKALRRSGDDDLLAWTQELNPDRPAGQ
jgi:transcriptional regulator